MLSLFMDNLYAAHSANAPWQGFFWRNYGNKPLTTRVPLQFVKPKVRMLHQHFQSLP